MRIETAKSLVRLVSNMSFCEKTVPNANQNLLLSVSENELKANGHAANMFNACVVENDACNLSTIGFLFGAGATGNSFSSSQSSGFSSTTNILYAQKKVSYFINTTYGQ